jgi:1,6-anhydro-N-acetylmuramate kinase
MSESADTRLVVGCMTGTSIDALDAALVRIRGHGLAMRCEFIRGVTHDLGPVRAGLRALADQRAMTAGEIARLSREFALLHAAAVRDLLGRGGAVRPALVAVHGQTVFHEPPSSWQMFNGAVLAHELGVPVVFDLRGADLAAGGQGAPITPLADWIMFRTAEPTAVVNLGGFCNATLLPPEPTRADAGAAVDRIEGFDVCACNHLLDRIAREALGCAFDADGAAALSGNVDDAARRGLAEALVTQSRAGRSLGTGDETWRWVDRWQGRLAGKDLAATACAAIAGAIASRLGPVGAVLLAGGGARNRALVGALERAMPGSKTDTTAARGVPIEFREACAMGVLGAMCADRVPITLPKVTGVREPAPIAGVWAGA